jgi:glucokinase-like ROK family protein
MSKTRTGNQALVRDINLKIVLGYIRERSPVSRAALATATGLNKTTVSSLVQRLLDLGLVVEVGAGKTEEVGRPGILLELDAKAGHFIGVEVGVDFVSVMITDFSTEVVWRAREATRRARAPQAVISRTVELIREGMEQAGLSDGDILGLGLGVPGLVDVPSGTLLFGPNLGWEDVPLRELIAGEFAFPVYVENEANIAALGESYFGAARGASSVVYVSAGVGLGGGIVLGGQVLPGAAGLVGEVGHMTILPDGLPCSCGNRGCWETLAGKDALFRRVKGAVASGKRTRLEEMTRGDLDGLTVALVTHAAREGDEVAIGALERTGTYLGIGLANLVNVFNPEVVVFGGPLSQASEFLLPALEDELEQRALRWPLESARLRVASHRRDACVWGGIATVHKRVLSEPVETVGGKRQAEVTVSQPARQVNAYWAGRET